MGVFIANIITIERLSRVQEDNVGAISDTKGESLATPLSIMVGTEYFVFDRVMQGEQATENISIDDSIDSGWGREPRGEFRRRFDVS